MKNRNYHQKTIIISTAVAILALTSIHAFSKPSIRGEMANCRVVINKKTFVLSLNQNNAFDRVSRVPANSIASIEVHFPQGNAGEVVIAEVQDGGSFEDGSGLVALTLANDKKIHFNFKTGGDQGSYVVTLRKGNDVKTVELWVGDEEKPSAE